MELSIEMVSLIAYLVTSTLGAAMWVGKLSTRVAVLEAGHDAMHDLLQEIKQDIKELVDALHGSEAGITRRKKKP